MKSVPAPASRPAPYGKLQIELLEETVAKQKLVTWPVLVAELITGEPILTSRHCDSLVPQPPTSSFEMSRLQLLPSHRWSRKWWRRMGAISYAHVVARHKLNRGAVPMFELPGVWESLIVDYVGEVLGGDEAQYSCSTPDGGLKFEVTIPHNYITRPAIQQRIRELFRHRELPTQGLTIRIPGSKL